jgi:hypothetical protein
MCFHTDDAWIEANRFFPVFHTQYPDALFIFNDRPVDSWIRSRKNKEGFVDLACSYFRSTPSEIEAIWRKQYLEHRKACLDYAPRMRNFLHFDIENDSPDKLISFVRRSFIVADGTYQLENPTSASRLDN